MPTKVEEFISRLPDYLQPLARQYTDLTVEQISERIIAISDLVLSGQSVAALGRAFADCPTTNLLVIYDAINLQLTALADAKQYYAEAKRSLLLEAVRLLVGALAAKVAG